jgi:L-alanine-DL-glutamate epimerase-like enolase superfamily enzyme
MKLYYTPYTLQLKHPFGIAGNTRTTTPIVLVKIEYEGFVGYGEASLPPYLLETQESVISFLKQVNFSGFRNPLDINAILNYVDDIMPNNTAAKASVDIALHDLIGKILQKPWHELYMADVNAMPATSITIGIDNDDVIKQKTLEATGFDVLKVKLGGEDDKRMITTIRSVSDTPISVDVNQGWKTKEHALEMIQWLHEKNTLFIEQPMPKSQIEDIAWLTARSPLPIIADESIQRFTDIDKVKDAYNGINIKLMKCAGMREAYKMIKYARALNLKILIGCMNESSCANLAAAHLAPFADWVDLDGPFLIKNNPFADPVLENGKIKLSVLPGLGCEPIVDLSFTAV